MLLLVNIGKILDLVMCRNKVAGNVEALAKAGNSSTTADPSTKV